MIEEHSENGPELRLRPHGIGRYFAAVFLLVWLGGWAVGESFALAALIRGALSLLAGEPIRNGHSTMPLGIALAIGGFLLLWLTLWTVGGVMALRELLRLLWAEDRFVVEGDALEIEHRLGPFTTRRRVARADLLAIEVRPRRGRLVATTAKSEIEISGLGAREERARVAAWLSNHLGIDAARATSEPALLPQGWEEIVTPEGAPALITSSRVRAGQARFTGVIAAVMTAFAVGLGRQALRQPSLIPGLVIVSAAAAGLVWCALWLARGRMEWRIGSGSLTLVRRFGPTTQDQMTAMALEITLTRDSDGDEWYALEALAEGATAPGPTSGKTRRRILHVMNDAGTPRRLGAWLAGRTGMPFHDRSTAEVQAADLAALRAQLEQSGKLGQLAARFIDKLDKNRVA